MDTQNIPPKVYVGNATEEAHRVTVTLNVTELLKWADYYRLSDNGCQYIDITLLPFMEGKNKFGKTHYAILKTPLIKRK